MYPDVLKTLGLIAAVLGAIVIISNPIAFQDFPFGVSPSSWIGLALLVGGLVVLIYGFKD